MSHVAKDVYATYHPEDIPSEQTSLELSFLWCRDPWCGNGLSLADHNRVFLRREICPQSQELQIMMKPKIRYADYQRMEQKLEVRDFERLQRKEILEHFRAYQYLGLATPTWSAHQLLDDKRRQFFQNRPNKYLSNLFAILAASWGHTVTGIGQFVVTGGTVTTGTGTNDYLNLLEADANSMLGTDTSTTTMRGMWELSLCHHPHGSFHHCHSKLSIRHPAVQDLQSDGLDCFRSGLWSECDLRQSHNRRSSC